MKAVRVVRINSSCLRHCILRKHDPLRQTTISTLVGYRRQNRDKRFPNIKSSNFSDDRPPSPLLKRLPNIITSMRIAGCPFLAYAIANDMKGIALGGCLFAGATDWLDGFIARKYNAATPFGAFLDPLADKIFIGSITIGLCMTNILPPLLAFVIIGRDVLLISGSFYLRAKEKKPASAFFDISTTTFNVKPSTLSKVNTAAQFSVLIGSLGHFGFGVPSMIILEPLWYLTAVTTIASGLGYLSGGGLNRESMFKRNDKVD